MKVFVYFHPSQKAAFEEAFKNEPEHALKPCPVISDTETWYVMYESICDQCECREECENGEPIFKCNLNIYGDGTLNFKGKEVKSWNAMDVKWNCDCDFSNWEMGGWTKTNKNNNDYEEEN